LKLLSRLQLIQELYTNEIDFTLNEAITISDVKKWQKEFQAFTKNIKRIKNGNELVQVYNAWNIWRDKFEKFVYKRLFGTQQSNANKEMKDSVVAKEAASKVWSLVMQGAENFFYIFDMPNNIRKEMENNGLDRGRGKAKYGDGEAWEVAYSIFDKSRTKKYNKLSRLGREAFKSLDNYFEALKNYTGAESESDKWQEYTINMNGAKVIAVSSEKKVEGADEMIKKVLPILKKVYAMLKAKRFDKVWRGSTIYVDPVSELQSAAARYELYDDSVHLYFLARNPHEMVHELGHRYWHKFLKPAAQNEWEEFIKKNTVRLSDSELDIIEKAFWKTYNNIKVGEMLLLRTYDFIKDEVVKEKYRAAVQADFNHDRLLTSKKIEDGEKSAARALRNAKNYVLNGPIIMTTITTYSGKSPDEAFCEAFAQYVTNFKMNPIVRQMIIKIT